MDTSLLTCSARLLTSTIYLTAGYVISISNTSLWLQQDKALENDHVELNGLSTHCQKYH